MTWNAALVMEYCRVRRTQHATDAPTTTTSSAPAPDSDPMNTVVSTTDLDSALGDGVLDSDTLPDGDAVDVAVAVADAVDDAVAVSDAMTAEAVAVADAVADPDPDAVAAAEAVDAADDEADADADADGVG